MNTPTYIGCNVSIACQEVFHKDFQTLATKESKLSALAIAYLVSLSRNHKNVLDTVSEWELLRAHLTEEKLPMYEEMFEHLYEYSRHPDSGNVTVAESVVTTSKKGYKRTRIVQRPMTRPELIWDNAYLWLYDLAVSYQKRP
jgi:hypothetical protein